MAQTRNQSPCPKCGKIRFIIPCRKNRLCKKCYTNRPCIDRKKKIFKIVCPKCKKERFVASPQAWNIRVGNSSSNCPKCKTGINKFGLSKGWGWNKGLKGYHQGHPPYVKLFGENNPAWRGGITKEHIKIRNSTEYTNWRKKVFERDDYTCLFCKKRGGDLVADHIKPFSIFKDLRLDINNGRTLCQKCHHETETYGGRALKCLKLK
jgi:hypothetical protein